MIVLGNSSASDGTPTPSVFRAAAPVPIMDADEVRMLVRDDNGHGNTLSGPLEWAFEEENGGQKVLRVNIDQSLVGKHGFAWAFKVVYNF